MMLTPIQRSKLDALDIPSQSSLLPGNSMATAFYKDSGYWHIEFDLTTASTMTIPEYGECYRIKILGDGFWFIGSGEVILFRGYADTEKVTVSGKAYLFPEFTEVLVAKDSDIRLMIFIKVGGISLTDTLLEE